MIKFDKVTLEPKFIDPSMCFCGGGGGNGGGGAPTEGTNAINRGTVGMTAAEMNARAEAQERGSREVANLSAGISDNISPSFGRSEPEVAGGYDDDEDYSDSFVTSTEAAYRDLDRRADIGQMPNLSKGLETPIGRIPTVPSIVFGALNKFGMNRAQDIRDQIFNAGGVPVTDRYGRIQGVVSEGTGPISNVLGALGLKQNVYTGNSSFAPSASQLRSYRPDPTRQGIASLPYANVQMPTTTRTVPLAAQPLSAPKTGSIINVDDRNFIVTEKGPVELKGTALQELVSPRPNFDPPNTLSGIQNTGGLGSFLDSAAYLMGFTKPSYAETPPQILERRPDGSYIETQSTPTSREPLPDNLNMYGTEMFDLGNTEVGTYQDSYLSPQYGTINDPTAQAGLGSFFTETVPGFFSTTPAQAKSSKAKAKSDADRFKGTNVRTKPVGPVEYFTNLFG